MTTLTGQRVRAFLYHNEQHHQVHWFTLPKFGEPKFYTTITSYNAFRNREAGRLVRCLDDKRAGKRYVIPEWRTYCNIIPADCPMYETEKALKMYEEFPTFEHATLWDFYLAIGYDFKRQKYQPRTQA